MDAMGHIFLIGTLAVLATGGGYYIKTVGNITHSSRVLCSASARDVFQQLTTVPTPPHDQKFSAPCG